MKVLITRNLGTKGMIKKSTTFSLGVRAELTPEEEALIQKCDAGGTVLYNWAIEKHDIQISTTVNSIVKGTSIECEDFVELIEAEDSIKQACAAFKGLLDRAETFGEEVVLEF